MSTKGSEWWCEELQHLRREARRICNQARNTDNPSDWARAKGAQKAYRDAVVKAKRRSWERFCESVMDVAAAARLCRILARDPVAKMEAFRRKIGIRGRRSCSPSGNQFFRIQKEPE